MSPELQLVVAFVIFLGLLVGGMTVPFAILVPGIVYLYLQEGWPALNSLGLVSYGSMNSYTLTSIPLFLFMAEVVQQSGLGFRVYRGFSALVGRIPGGLLHTNVVGCAAFAAVSGSSVATAAAIGSVALPQLRQRGYDERLSVGSLAAGGTLGILIPPSIAMIIYGAFTETSVAKLFMAGVVPGLMLTVMFMAYLLAKGILSPSIAPIERSEFSAARLIMVVSDVLPFIILIGLIAGTIYSGIATPTEAAAAACIFAMLIARLSTGMTWRDMMKALWRTVELTGNVLFITYAAFIFAYAISYAGIGEQLTEFIVGLKLSKIEFMLALFVLYTGLGALVESLGMIVITVPLVFPVLASYHIDPVWFGIVLVMFIEMGQISPPIGINLFVIQSIARGSMKDVIMGTIPFHVLMLVLLLLLVVWPDIALWLPSQMAASR